VAEIASELRGVIRRVAPALLETMKWGNPCYVGRENVCYLAAYAGRVNLGFFRGAELAARPGLLEGTGKGLRHVKVRDAKRARDPSIRAIVREAVALDAAGPKLA
jgi:hypothetical protein